MEAAPSPIEVVRNRSRDIREKAWEPRRMIRNSAGGDLTTRPCLRDDHGLAYVIPTWDCLLRYHSDIMMIVARALYRR